MVSCRIPIASCREPARVGRPVLVGTLTIEQSEEISRLLRENSIQHNLLNAVTDQSEAEWQRAFELFGLFAVDKGIEDLKTTLAHLRGLPDCNGKAGSIGYCLGGKMAFLMATRSDADCNVSYYGVGLDDLLGESGAISKPLLLHVASEDQFFPKDAQKKLAEGLAGHPHVSRQVYEGQDHAFARIGGAHYDAAAAALANGRSLDCLREGLAA